MESRHGIHRNYFTFCVVTPLHTFDFINSKLQTHNQKPNYIRSCKLIVGDVEHKTQVTHTHFDTSNHKINPVLS